jgi:transposase
MKPKPGRPETPSERLVRDIRRVTRKHYSAEEKIRIVLDGLRGECSIAELCRREGIAESHYYSWSKEFLEAGKRRLAGDTRALRPAVKSPNSDARRRSSRQSLLSRPSYEAMGVKRIVSERQWQILEFPPVFVCPVSKVLSPIARRGSFPSTINLTIRSPLVTVAPTSRLRRAGLRKTRTILENGVSGHGLLRFVDLDPSGLILSWGLRDWLGAYRHAVFIAAPSMTTPVTYFQRATSSFRASAAIVVLRRRPPLRFTRSWNQRASAESG